jgi:hypothetical protein
MIKAASLKKTPEQIRAATDKLISEHEANVQRWLIVHHPNAATVNMRSSEREENLGAPMSSQKKLAV